MFKIVESLDDLIKTYAVRAIVFIGEQKCPYDEEIDEHEHSSIHILGELNGEPIASARIRFPGSYAKLERIAVRKQWRGQGIGRKLVDRFRNQDSFPHASQPCQNKEMLRFIGEKLLQCLEIILPVHKNPWFRNGRAREKRFFGHFSP